jgi:dienelactone hydrolase
MMPRFGTLVLAALLAAPAFAQDRIEIAAREGAAGPAKLLAWLSKPEGAGPFPAVVMLHGCGGAYNAQGALNMRHQQWERAFRGAGYAVLQVDSFTTRDIKEICTRRDRPVTAGGARRRDALAGLAWLQAQPFVRGDRVAVVGWSNGGSTTLAAMERRDDDPADLRFRVGVAFYPGCLAAGGGTFKPGGPLLIVMGDSDNWTPPAPCRPMVAEATASGQDVALHLYAGAYHDFDWPGLKLRTRTGLASAKSGSATVGEDPAARADALQRVPAYLAGWLKK